MLQISHFFLSKHLHVFTRNIQNMQKYSCFYYIFCNIKSLKQAIFHIEYSFEMLEPLQVHNICVQCLLKYMGFLAQ